MSNRLFVSSFASLLWLVVPACMDPASTDDSDADQPAAEGGAAPVAPRQIGPDIVLGEHVVLSQQIDDSALNCGLNDSVLNYSWHRYCIRNCSTYAINRRVGLSNGNYGPCLRVSGSGQICDFIHADPVGLGGCTAPIN